MATAIPTSDDAANAPENMQAIGWHVRDRLFSVVPLKTLFHTEGEKLRPVIAWKERDEWIILCVKMGMNAREIRDLSFSWPQPITTTQQVYDKIVQLNLKRRYKHGQKKLRVGSHNENIIYVFSKLTGQAVEYGLEVSDVMRDACPDGARFRPDLRMTIGERRFFVEVQLSKIEGTRWAQKFRNYLKLYETIRTPFRVLFLIDKRDDVAKLKRYARWVLKERANLNLYLFMTLAEFRYQTDILKARVWYGAWGTTMYALH